MHMQETVLFKLSSLQQQLSESVSVADMDKANQQYNQLAIKYQQLLSQQTAYTATTANVDQLQVLALHSSPNVSVLQPCHPNDTVVSVLQPCHPNDTVVSVLQPCHPNDTVISMLQPCHPNDTVVSEATMKAY